MFYYDLSDLAEAEFRRRQLDQSSGPVTRPVQTDQQIRAELAEQHRRRDRATELAKAGLWPLALEELGKPQACVGEPVAEHAELALIGSDALAEQVRPEGDRFDPNATPAAVDGRDLHLPDPLRCDVAQAEVPFREVDQQAAPLTKLGGLPDETPQEIQNGGEKVNFESCCAKVTTSKSGPANSVNSASYPYRTAPDACSPSLNGRDPLAPEPPQGSTEAPVPPRPALKKKRRRPHDVPWHEKRQIRKHKITKRISIQKRRAAIEAYDRAKVLRKPFNVTITLNPGTDHLDPVERIRFWDQYLVKLQSYCAARRKSAKKAPSWFPCFYILARESDPHTHRGEHAHMLVHAPDAEEARRLIDVVNGAGRYKGWGVNILAQHADTLERFKGIKRQWALGYLLKASGMQAVRADRANWIKPSGAIAGERVRISENLTNPEVVAKTEVAVETYARVRKEKAWSQKVRLAQRRSKPWVTPPAPVRPDAGRRR